MKFLFIFYLKLFVDGKPFNLEEIWHLFHVDKDATITREDMLSILTQMDHPILFRPYFCLHPCRTSELLAATPKSRNRILTFISVMGPYIHLNLDNNYGLHYKNVENV